MSGVKDVGMEDTCNICKVGTLKTLCVQLVVVMNVSLFVKLYTLVFVYIRSTFVSFDLN